MAVISGNLCFLRFGRLLVPALCFAAQMAVADSASFTRDIMPILSAKCFACHGPDETKRKAGLRLDTPENAYKPLASNVTALVPGNRTASALYERISAANPEDRMPPPDFPKTLSPGEIELLGRWIDEGAQWEEHWAFRPMQLSAVPDAPLAGWARNNVDRFIAAKLAQEGLAPSPEADRATLIRRLSFDLLGLPPTPEEINLFVHDTAPDAYERLVDRMLASPRYGERWARHWLDVAHYADTHGYDKDKRRPNAWPYRDYVIRSLNADRPYGRFVEEQLAGDVLAPGNPEGVIALGFIAAGPWDFVGHAELREGTVDKKITRLIDRDDMVTAAMGAFTSTTVGCARCHDHKFDPISQREYYGLQAVFAGVDRADRAFDADSGMFGKRQALLAEKQTISTRLRDIENERIAKASPEVEEVQAKLEEVSKRVAAIELTQSSPSNGYHSEVSAQQDATKWVQIDLGAPRMIGKIRLVPARPTDFPDTKGFGFPHRFRVETSTDAAFSEPIVLMEHAKEDFPNPKDKNVEVDGPPIPVQFVRVTATRLWQRTNDYVFALAEVQAEADGKAISENAPVTALDSIEQGRWSTRFLVDSFGSRQKLHYDQQAFDGLAALKEEERVLNERREQLLDQGLDAVVREERAGAWARLPKLDEELAGLPPPQLVYAAASDYAPNGNFSPPQSPREIHVLRRGDVNQEADLAQPGALGCVPGLQAVFALDATASEAARRAALARWITDPANTLTWRSIVNRVWHYHFGRGIVETPNDFGHMGAPPTHPELLDWLALEFLAHGQSLKWLHKEIVISATYRQQSTDDPAKAQLDASNRYLWRMNRRQLEAEALRDATLAVSGCLDLTMGGPGIDLFGFVDDHSPRYLYDELDVENPATWRRTVYRFIVRSVPDPFMETLDCADPSQSVPARNTTITALQALALMNNKFVISQAAHFAERLDKLSGNPEERLRLAYLNALGRAPSAEELKILDDYATKYGLPSACRVLLNSNEFVFVD